MNTDVNHVPSSTNLDTLSPSFPNVTIANNVMLASEIDFTKLFVSSQKGRFFS